MIRTDFSDSKHWLELANKHLGSYQLPEWPELCHQENMLWWLERMDLDEDGYKRITKTSLEEFRNLNPDWPLMAFIGLMLEFCDEQHGREESDSGIDRKPSP